MASWRACPHCGTHGLLAFFAIKGVQVLRTLCFPFVCPQCQGPVCLTESPCALLPGPEFLVLSFVSCLQMQQKVQVTVCFDLLTFLFCFGVYALLYPSRCSCCFSLPSTHLLPWHSPTWLQPQPSLAFPDMCGRMPPARLSIPRLCLAGFRDVGDRGGSPAWDSDAHWWSSPRSNRMATHRQKPVQFVPG